MATKIYAPGQTVPLEDVFVSAPKEAEQFAPGQVVPVDQVIRTPTPAPAGGLFQRPQPRPAAVVEEDKPSIIGTTLKAFPVGAARLAAADLRGLTAITTGALNQADPFLLSVADWTEGLPPESWKEQVGRFEPSSLQQFKENWKDPRTWGAAVMSNLPFIMQAWLGSAIGAPIGGALAGGAAIVATPGLPDEILAAPAGVIAGGLGGAVVATGLAEAGFFIGAAHDLGIDQDIAEKWARVYGPFAGLIEAPALLFMGGPLKKAFSGMPKLARKGLLNRALIEAGGMLGEGAEEVAQGGLQAFLLNKAIEDQRVRDPNYIIDEQQILSSDSLVEFLTAAGVTAIMRGAGGAIGTVTRPNLTKRIESRVAAERTVAERAIKEGTLTQAELVIKEEIDDKLLRNQEITDADRTAWWDVHNKITAAGVDLRQAQESGAAFLAHDAANLLVVESETRQGTITDAALARARELAKLPRNEMRVLPMRELFDIIKMAVNNRDTRRVEDEVARALSRRENDLGRTLTPAERNTLIPALHAQAWDTVRPSLRVIREAEQAGHTTKQEADLMRHLVTEVNPNFDERFALELPAIAGKANAALMKELGYPEVEGETTGHTQLRELQTDEGPALKTLITIFSNGDVETMVHEWYEGVLKVVPEDQREMIRRYYEDRPSPFKWNDQFAHDAVGYFFSHHHHQRVGPILKLFETAKRGLERLLRMIAGFRQVNLPVEIQEIMHRGATQPVLFPPGLFDADYQAPKQLPYFDEQNLRERDQTQRMNMATGPTIPLREHTGTIMGQEDRIPMTQEQQNARARLDMLIPDPPKNPKPYAEPAEDQKDIGGLLRQAQQELNPAQRKLTPREIDPIRDYILDQGGIRSYRKTSFTGKAPLAEEISAIPLAYRRKKGRPLDEILDEMQRLGLAPADWGESDLIEHLGQPASAEFDPETQVPVYTFSPSLLEDQQAAVDLAQTNIKASEFIDSISTDPELILTYSGASTEQLKQQWEVVDGTGVTSFADSGDWLNVMLTQMTRATDPFGSLVVDYSIRSPSGVTLRNFEKMLAVRFYNVKVVGGDKSNPIYEATGPRHSESTYDFPGGERRAETLGNSLVPLDDAGGEIVFEGREIRSKDQFQEHVGTPEFSAVNTRLKSENKLVGLLLGGFNIHEDRGRGLTARQMLQEVQAAVSSGWVGRLLSSASDPKDMATEAGYKGAERQRFLSQVNELRTQPLFLTRQEPPRGATAKQKMLDDKGQASRSINLPLFSGVSTTGARDAYFAKDMNTPEQIQKSVRSALLLLSDPEAWGEQVAGEVAQITRSEMPMIRLLGTGDMTAPQIVQGINALARRADREIHVSSRQPGMLLQLDSGHNAPIHKMLALDIQNYTGIVNDPQYGRGWLSSALSENGIVLTWLYTDATELPFMRELYASDGLHMVFAANEDLWRDLKRTDPALGNAALPADAAAATFTQSSGMARLSQIGTFMRNQVLGVDKNARTWVLSDPMAPGNLIPASRFITEDSESDAYSFATVTMLGDVLAASTRISEGKARKAGEVPKDPRNPGAPFAASSAEEADIVTEILNDNLNRVSRADFFRPAIEQTRGPDTEAWQVAQSQETMAKARGLTLAENLPEQQRRYWEKFKHRPGGEDPALRTFEVREDGLTLSAAIGKNLKNTPPGKKLAMAEALDILLAPEGALTQARSLPIPPKILDSVNRYLQKFGFAGVGDTGAANIVERVKKIINKGWGQRKWSETELVTKVERSRQQVTKMEDEDMIFYAEKTGNPKITGDTFESLSLRLGAEAKNSVNQTFRKDQNEMWKRLLATPWVGDQEVQDRYFINNYVAHLYKNTPDQIFQAYQSSTEQIRRKFGTKNPRLMDRSYATYMEALLEGMNSQGLEPRFTSFHDLWMFTGRQNIRLIFNNELMARIKEIETATGQPLIARPGEKDPKAKAIYNAARNHGWVQTDEPYLRWRIAGEKDNGEPIFTQSEGPAYVHPALSWALKEVFDPNLPEGPVWKAYDNASQVLRTTRVSFSAFHFGPLFGSGFALNHFHIFTPEWHRNAKKAMDDPEITRQYFLDGGRIGAPSDVNPGLVVSVMDKVASKLDALPARGLVVPGVVIRAFGKSQAFVNKVMWDYVHRRLKLGTYMHYVNREQRKLAKGLITEEQFRSNRVDIAAMTNDSFGGQAWEVQRVLANPKFRKVMYRLGGYPDWSWSAIRQAAFIAAPGFRGKMARRYWLRYGMAFVALQNMLNLLFTGMVQDPDDEQKKEGILAVPKSNVWWIPSKSRTCNENTDPQHFGMFPFVMDFQLPDIEFGYAGHTYNPGRAADGRRLYSHTGKQMLEIQRYFTDPLGAVFSKANPLIQIAATQWFAGTPHDGDRFPARGAYDRGLGEYLPWDATRPHTLPRAWSRLQEAASAAVPFSFRDFSTRGPLPIAGFQVSKGMSIRSARIRAADAYREGDFDLIAKIIRTLQADRRSTKQIKSVLTSARRAAQPDRPAP